MHRSTIVKSLSLAGVALSLMGAGVPSAAAATTAQTPVTAASTTGASATTTGKSDKQLAPVTIQPRLSVDEMAQQVATYGDVKDTLIKLSGTKNTRDIGGYKTADGKWQIKHNRLLRSDNLNKLTNTDKTILSKDHHVTSVVDFRTNGQINKQPDQLIPGAANTDISILGEYAFTDGTALDASKFAGDGGFYVQQLEFGFSAVNGYNKFLNMLLANNQATLYHCSSGKDRTGIATVLVMSIFGMDRKTIMNDFMQSYQTGRTVKPDWLNEYFREILSRYGTMEKYITKVLNFSPAQQSALRTKYLVSADGKNTPYTDPNTPKPTPAPTPAPSTPSVVAPAPSTKPENEKPVKPAPAPTTTEPTTPVKPHKAKKVKGKITSTKKLNTKYVYHLKSNKKWFKDSYLQKLLGHTSKKHKNTTWKLTKVERIKIKGKTHTYYQIKDHAGHKAWILKSYVVKIKANTANHQA
ncbi:tyrosine-protein phosphatase [Levilactobacillus fujinensis]|uniref:Tyrosine-protein phosphatase n=1 Tax=Levilactobacillus fujinensis TaxID=2486024 RepID=A0ABW1TDL7_9LACO|nr:tyrosine-protein phosphatase [Levilactobacillus fujinensis]